MILDKLYPASTDRSNEHVNHYSDPVVRLVLDEIVVATDDVIHVPIPRIRTNLSHAELIANAVISLIVIFDIH